MNTLNFTSHFGTEENCWKHYFKKQEDKSGVFCKQCKGKEHYWLASKWSHQYANHVLFELL